MTGPAASQGKPNYGLDAPPVIRTMFALGAAGIVAAVLLFAMDLAHPAHIPVGEICALLGLNSLLNAVGMIYYSKVAKLHRREQLLDLVPWRGDETVLD